MLHTGILSSLKVTTVSTAITGMANAITRGCCNIITLNYLAIVTLISIPVPLVAPSVPVTKAAHVRALT